MTLEQLSQQMQQLSDQMDKRFTDVNRRLDNLEGSIIALSRPVVEIQDYLKQHGFCPEHPADVYNTPGLIEHYAKQPVTK